jgi:hypothetical protein
VISKGENSEVLVEAIRELLGQAAALSLSIGIRFPRKWTYLSKCSPNPIGSFRMTRTALAKLMEQQTDTDCRQSKKERPSAVLPAPVLP